MVLLPALLFPVALMLLVIAMEHLERSFRSRSVGDRVAISLHSAHPEEVESLVSRDAAAALERYWRRRTATGPVRPQHTAARR